MILWDLPPGSTLFRAHTPQWASDPLSGAGAAAKGGRFNREGVEALYLSLDEVTALREYQQTSPFLQPCTMTSYTATLTGLFDLRQLHRGDPWDDRCHNWREEWMHQIGSASARERVSQNVLLLVLAGAENNKKELYTLRFVL